MASNMDALQAIFGDGRIAKLGNLATQRNPAASGNSQVAITRGSAAGSIVNFGTQQSPSSVTTTTSAEKSFTVTGATANWKIAAGDLLYVNKPTSQAGLGMGNVRVSAANTAGVTFTNFSAGTLTPTTSETYALVAIRGFNILSATLTPAAVLANSITEQQFAVTGVRAGELVQVSKPAAQAGLDIAGCRVVSDNVVGISFVNVTTSTITPTAGESYSVLSLGGLDAVNNELVYQVGVGTPAGTATVTVAEQGFSITGLLATDIIKGVSKPTAQAGLGIAGYRVSAAGSLGISFVNPTAGSLTATASEVYGVSVHRPNPVAPLLIYTQSLAPVSVAANTTAEQTFTVTGLISGTPVWVNKPSFQSGLGIMGVRVSATSTLAITYCNATAAAIVPATETYVIGNFQMPTEANGNSVIQTASLVDQQASILTNAIRSALVTEGVIIGS